MWRHVLLSCRSCCGTCGRCILTARIAAVLTAESSLEHAKFVSIPTFLLFERGRVKDKNSLIQVLVQTRGTLMQFWALGLLTQSSAWDAGAAEG